MAEVKEVKITDEYVSLGQFLKLCDLITSGGEAKFFLKGNLVFVNGEREDRRGRKLHDQDLVEINNEVYKVCR